MESVKGSKSRLWTSDSILRSETGKKPGDVWCMLSVWGSEALTILYKYLNSRSQYQYLRCQRWCSWRIKRFRNSIREVQVEIQIHNARSLDKRKQLLRIGRLIHWRFWHAFQRKYGQYTVRYIAETRCVRLSCMVSESEGKIIVDAHDGKQKATPTVLRPSIWQYPSGPAVMLSPP